MVDTDEASSTLLDLGVAIILDEGDGDLWTVRGDDDVDDEITGCFFGGVEVKVFPCFCG